MGMVTHEIPVSTALAKTNYMEVTEASKEKYFTSNAWKRKAVSAQIVEEAGQLPLNSIIFTLDNGDFVAMEPLSGYPALGASERINPAGKEVKHIRSGYKDGEWASQYWVISLEIDGVPVEIGEDTTQPYMYVLWDGAVDFETWETGEKALKEILKRYPEFNEIRWAWK